MAGFHGSILDQHHFATGPIHRNILQTMTPLITSITSSRILVHSLGNNTVLIPTNPIQPDRRSIQSTTTTSYQSVPTEVRLYHRQARSAGTNSADFTKLWTPPGGQGGSIPWSAWPSQFRSGFQIAGSSMQTTTPINSLETSSRLSTASQPLTFSTTSSSSTSSSPPNSATSSNSSQHISTQRTTIIIAVVCSALLVICFFLAILILLWRRHRRHHQKNNIFGNEIENQDIHPYNLTITSSTSAATIGRKEEIMNEPNYLNAPVSVLPASSIPIPSPVQQDESTTNVDIRNLRERIQYLEAIVELTPPPDYPGAVQNNTNSASGIGHSTT